MPKSSEQFDVIIIGAGINGAGIARDAARRGLKVLLLDKGDIGGGTSSWSTRLIHGGLRYLEHGEFGLVRESLRERETLLRIAPHLVRRLPLLVPIYKHARRGRWKVRIGMVAYDLLSRGKSLPKHRMLSVAETLRQIPELNRAGLVGAAIYSDAQVEFAERLVLENVLSAVEHGAQLQTYARVNSLIVTNEKVCGVEFMTQVALSQGLEAQDGMSQGREGGRAPALQSARSAIVINAAGPWVDHVLAGANSPQLIGGTKGSHLIVGPFRGAPAAAIYAEAETDGRPFFIIPWNGKYLIGTTDIRYEGNPDDATIEDDEVDYLLRETNRVIPVANLGREQILFTYSGVRPLPFTSEKHEESITRRHFIREHRQLRGLFSIVGGKLTTYRSLAEETVDLVLTRLGRPAVECMTDREPLPGAGASSDERLARIYGSRASMILDLVTANPSLAEVVDDETGAIAAEIVFAFKHEFAQTLADCLLRRTMIGLNSTRGLNAVEAAGPVAQQFLGWSEQRRQEEIAEYRKAVDRIFAKHLAGASPPS